MRKIGWRVSAALCVAALSQPWPAGAKTAVELPVSEIGNTAFLSSASERPWWNGDWKRRAGLLVASAADVEDRNVMVDAVVDFGEAVDPDGVRLVTPWEEEVPCVAEKEAGTAIRLLFRTALRVRENRPFLVYWGNPQAKRPDPTTSLSMRRDGDDLRILNGKLEVVLDLGKHTEGLIRRLRVLGSQAPSELLTRATGYAWSGFSPVMGRGGWTNAVVVSDNAFKKAVRFEYPAGAMTMSVYDEQPRVDWRYDLAAYADSVEIHVSWACAGDVGFDRIIYPSLTGKVLSVPGALDSATDCIPNPQHDLTPYVKEGWYAIDDRRESDVVGFLFDRKALATLFHWGHGQAGGVQVKHRFRHELAKPGKDVSGSGAIVATSGRWQDVRAERARLSAKPLVFAGRAEGFREIAVTRPRLDRDWVYSVDSSGWLTSEPLKGADWATNVACRLRALGANVSRLGDGWKSLPVPRDLYVSATNRVAPLKRKLATWGEGWNFTGVKLSEQCGAAHAKGMSVGLWSGFCPVTHNLDRTDPDLVRLDVELQNLYPKCGVDCVFNAAAAGEGAHVPPALREANGNDSFLRWKRVEDFFAAQDANTERVKEFYRESKRRNPGLPVVMWNSENSEVGREMFMGDQAGHFDTCMVEILPHYDIVHVKNVVKRMRALFDNGAGRTVHHHYYFYGQDFAQRVSEVEMPFACGCNGFSQENLTYENYDRDATEIPADFARLAEYTRLGEKASRMAPVRNLAVFRDGAMYRYDVKHGRHGSKYGFKTRTDHRVHCVGNMRNYSFDIVVNRYFTRESLAKYRVVYVPEDPALTDALAEELVAFVKAGGGALLEGDSLGPKALKGLGLEDGVVRQVGKGKAVWFARPPNFDAAFRKTVADLGGRNPYDIASRTLDSVLQASDRGLLLSVFNAGQKTDTGRVTLLDAAIPGAPSQLFVLDVRRGERWAHTNGFEVTVAPRQFGFYLVGDDAFTALPETRPGRWDGASVRARFPCAAIPAVSAPTNFTQALAVEFTRGTAESPQATRRARDGRIGVRTMTADAYSARRMNEALEGATYLHFVATDTAAADRVFADCPDALKDLLKRGGGIVFDRMATGPKARAFLGEVGVYDPNAAAVTGEGRAVVCQGLSTNSLLRPQKGPGHMHLQFTRSFPKWDAKAQFATHVDRHHPDRAMAVAQEGVLGAGKVIFTQNDRAFNDWYENVPYGESVLSWVIGRPVGEHARLVCDMNGGVGQVVE